MEPGVAKRLLGAMEGVLVWGAVAALLAIVALVLLATLGRTFPFLIVPDNITFVRILLLMAIAMGLGYATGRNSHISADLVYALLPLPARRVCGRVRLHVSAAVRLFPGHR